MKKEKGIDSAVTEIGTMSRKPCKNPERKEKMRGGKENDNQDTDNKQQERKRSNKAKKCKNIPWQ